MPFSDFLAEGAEIPAGSALTSVTSQSTAPKWYTDYLQQTIAQQAAQGGAAYSPYQGPRVAGFTPDQTSSFEMTRQAADDYQPGINRATDLVTKAGALSGAAGAQGGLQRAGGMVEQAFNQQGGAAAAAPYVNAGQTTVQQGVNQAGGAAAAAPYVNAGQTTVQQGVNQQGGLAAGAANLQGGAGAIQGALGQPGGLDAAQGYLDRSMGNTKIVTGYMNPYQEEVVNRIGELGQRNLMEKIMPGLEGRYIKAGQFQGSGQMTDTARAIRDTSADILAQQSAALQQGYTQAQTAKAADLSRYGQLAQTAGNLGVSDQATGVQAGTALGNIGQAQGSLAETGRANTIQGGQAMGQFGQTLGTLAETGRGNTIQGGQAMGQFGQTAASAANADRGTSGQLGQAQGQLANQYGQLVQGDAQNANQAAQTQGQLAGDTQKLGLAGAGAVGAAGNQQQAFNQQNLDVGYQDYLRQQGYPQEQINNMVNTAKGLQPGVPLQGVREGIEPIGGSQTPGPSGASKVASGILGATSLLSEGRQQGWY